FILYVYYRVGGHALLDKPAEKQVRQFLLGRLSADFVGLALVAGFGQFEITGAPDLIERRLLNDKAAIDQRLEIDEPHIDIILEPVYPGYLDDAQARPFFEDGQRPFLVIGSGDHFEIVFRNKLGRSLIDRAVDNKAAAKSRNPVCAVCAAVSLGQVSAVRG